MIEHHDQKGYLRFAINLGNPVLTTLLPDGAPGGITVELANKLAAESQREARCCRINGISPFWLSTRRGKISFALRRHTSLSKAR